MKRVLPALLVSIAVLCPALSVAVASTVPPLVVFGGGVVMRPIPTSACKSAVDKPKHVTYIQCADGGSYRLAGRKFGASYGWLWTATRGNPAAREAGSFAINLGNGVLYLTTKGTARAVGKVTADAGTQKTTGTWKYSRGTGAYKNRSGSGTYTFDLKRNATTYLLLAISLKGTIH